jgi:predicted ribosomally synthesized peptide with SipW-like signal peptide
MNKKILASIFVIGILALAMGWGTYSFFSDKETSTDNIFQAGTLDLKMWDGSWKDNVAAVVVFKDLAPCVEQGPVIVWLKNTGTMAGKVYVRVASITDTNNIQTEAELDADPIGTVNDISNWIWVQLSWGGTRQTVWYKLSAMTTKIYVGDLAAGIEGYVDFYAHLDSATGNEYQGDKSTVTIEFIIEQA